MPKAVDGQIWIRIPFAKLRLEWPIHAGGRSRPSLQSVLLTNVGFQVLKFNEGMS